MINLESCYFGYFSFWMLFLWYKFRKVLFWIFALKYTTSPFFIVIVRILHLPGSSINHQIIFIFRAKVLESQAPEKSYGISPVNLFSARDRYCRLLSGSDGMCLTTRLPKMMVARLCIFTYIWFGLLTLFNLLDLCSYFLSSIILILHLQMLLSPNYICKGM